MLKFVSVVTLALLAIFSCPQGTLSCPQGTPAASDLYIGDTAIYNGDPAIYPKPNVLFILDNNSTMGNAASTTPYDPNDEYSGSYDPWTIYKLTGQANYPQHITSTSGDPTLADVTCSDAKTSLLAYGTYSAGGSDTLKSDGSCGNGGAGTTYLGNLLNFNEGATADGGDEDTGATQMDIIRSAVEIAAGGAKSRINIGLMVFGSNNKGGDLITPVQDLSSAAVFKTEFTDLFPGTPVTGVPLLTGNTRPMAESLMEARFYFDMDRTTSTSPISHKTFADSPITEICQKNIVVLITNGDSVGDSDNYTCEVLSAASGIGSSMTEGDYDGDGHTGDKCMANAYGNGTHLLDDAAKYAYDTDLSSTMDDIPTIQRIETHTLLVFSPHKDLLQSAAEKGHGTYHVATNASELSTALTDMFASFLLETDTAFVAPVVPTSPENRTYSGQRVYLGFFYPKNDGPWNGNMKKYGINSSGEIVDKNAALATENNGNFKDAKVDGSFTTSSFWSLEDAGRVIEGGVGEILLNRGFTSDTAYQATLADVVPDPMTNPSRNIYTYLTSTNSAVSAGSETTTLTDAQNRFYTGNANILYDTTLDLSDSSDKDKLIKFVHGLDSYDDDGDGSTTDMRGDDPATTTENEEWIMGDILHSKPSVINYAQYTFSTTNEGDCSTNKSTIYVGANDGMLHAFRDCDGQERWAFIPPDLLPNLQDLRGTKHATFVDSTPVPYIYDADRDGNIESADGDKVVLLFGLRRGGSSYYALDVTNPDAPVYLWSISSDSYPELGESWSAPQIGVVKTSAGITKVVAFVGAGYDNLNEDGRFGATQGFTNTDVDATLITSGAVTSTATVTAPLSGVDPVTNNHKGRGVYAFEVATLNGSGVPTIAGSATLVWSYLYAGTADSTHSTQLTYSIPSDITILDTDYDGYIDRLYAGDTGGQLWRFSQGNSTINKNLIDGSSGSNGWSAERIFLANSGSDGTTGRKIFYRPSVTLQIGGLVNLYFGTGDRAHPLNTAVIDRMYAVYDREQTTVSAIDEDDLVDVTENLLQENTTTASEITTLLTELYATTNYGWFIELNETGHDGEKVLAPGLAFNKVAYYTTFAPNVAGTDPCIPGNLGISRLYAVDYLTGEAVLNFATSNDATSTSDNTRALSDDGKVLRRGDRSIALGLGIPSGIVVVMPPSGDAKLLIGCGGGLCTEDPVTGGTIYPIYWRPY